MVRHFLRDDVSRAEFLPARTALLTWFLERSAS
jgi:hypothetical protein